eukprot:8609-Heterococcus_DN1.PRE.4
MTTDSIFMCNQQGTSNISNRQAVRSTQCERGVCKKYTCVEVLHIPGSSSVSRQIVACDNFAKSERLHITTLSLHTCAAVCYTLAAAVLAVAMQHYCYTTHSVCCSEVTYTTRQCSDNLLLV